MRSHQIDNKTQRDRNYKENQMEILGLKNSTEMKNSLVGLNSRFELAQERVSKLEDRSIEVMKFKEQREKRMKNRTLEKWDTIKHTNICMM